MNMWCWCYVSSTSLQRTGLKMFLQRGPTWSLSIGRLICLFLKGVDVVVVEEVIVQQKDESEPEHVTD